MLVSGRVLGTSPIGTFMICGFNARLRLARLARLTSLLRAFPEAMMLLKGGVSD